MEQKLQELYDKVLKDAIDLPFYQDIVKRVFESVENILDGEKASLSMTDLQVLGSSITNSSSGVMYVMTLPEETKKSYIDLLLKIDIDQFTKDTSRLRKNTYATLLIYGTLLGNVEAMVNKIIDDYMEREAYYKNSPHVGNSELYVSPNTLESIVENYITMLRSSYSSTFQSFSYSDMQFLHSYVYENYITENTIQKLLLIPDLDFRNVPVKYVYTFLDLIQKNYFKLEMSHYGKKMYLSHYNRSYLMDRMRELKLTLTKECVEYVQSNRELFDSYEFFGAFAIKDYETFSAMNDELLSTFKSIGATTILEFIKEQKDFEKLARINGYISPEVIRASMDIIKQNPYLIKQYSEKIFPVRNYYSNIAFDNMMTIKDHIQLKDFLKII